MPAERLEIIFDTADRFPGRVTFDISFRNRRYVDHRDAGTPEASKIALDLWATTERAGFRYIRGLHDDMRRFVSAFPEAAAEPRRLVDRFRDQGYDVVVRGAYKAGKVLSLDELCSMSYDEHARADREEAAYAAGRAAQREGRSAEAVARLRAAVLAEEAPESIQIEDQSVRDAIRARQDRERDQVREIEMPSEEQTNAFAA